MTSLEVRSPGLAADLRERRSWSSAGKCPLVTVIAPWSPWRMARLWHAPGCRGRPYTSGPDARVAGAFLVRLARAGRDVGALVGVVSASALAAWVSCSASRWFSARALSESLFRALGADAQRVAGFFAGGDAGVGGAGEVVE
jgi:hypothetical protein